MDRDEQMRRVRYWIGKAENALDMTVAALTRAGELDQEWSEEFGSDATILREKIVVIRRLVNGS